MKSELKIELNTLILALTDFKKFFYQDQNLSYKSLILISLNLQFIYLIINGFVYQSHVKWLLEEISKTDLVVYLPIIEFYLLNIIFVAISLIIFHLFVMQIGIACVAYFYHKINQLDFKKNYTISILYLNSIPFIFYQEFFMLSLILLICLVIYLPYKIKKLIDAESLS